MMKTRNPNEPPPGTTRTGPEKQPATGVTEPGPQSEAPESDGRRSFLIGLGKWSGVLVTSTVAGGWLYPDRNAEAWIRRGGSWINRRGYGGGGWINGRGYRGGGGWINGRGYGGGSWINGRNYYGGGGSWVNRRGGGGAGWINRRW